MLHTHRAERADALIGALGDLLAAPPDDPFAADVIAIPTRGMERWLTQQLAARVGASAGRADGILANVEFPSLRALVDESVATALDGTRYDDPWQPARMLWPLLEVVDKHLGEAWLAILADHLHDTLCQDGERPRRLAAVRHLATLFDRYALYRPEMVHAWQEGADVDARGEPLPRETTWQPELWRRLRERIDQPGPAERTDDASARIEQDPAVLGLPPRIALFGLTRLPARYLQVLNAIATGRDMHLFLLHPSHALWDTVARDPTATAQNRLLRSWGKDSHDLQLVLGDPCAYADHPVPTETTADSLLQRIQADVRSDHQPDGQLALSDEDHSLEVHSCHGRARQVEVLRDAILHLLQEDPTLEPRDIVVMCPDIETFAPLIHATFGVGEIDDAEMETLAPEVRPPELRVRLADRSLRQTNPVLGTVSRLLELADQRLTASQVLDLADRGAVRRRFGFDDDDLTRLQDWISDSGVRWGLDAEHRAPFQLATQSANTWRAGLDRVLLGVTMTEDAHRLIGEALPLDDVESGAVELAGRFAEFIDRLRALVDDFAAPKPVTAWAASIAAAADAMTATTPKDAWQRAELDRILADVVADADAGGVDATIELAEARALLAERLQGRPTRTNFRTGHLTVCTLVPMRSVPHRVVCLLGLDDGVFPRKSPRDGDDLLLDAPRVGDYDSRAEDHQMLLDALLAATERLLITYSGHDERTNARKPSAVPVGQLLDVVDRTATTESGRPRDRIVVEHPLQPFDPQNFQGGRPWSFDHVTLDGARALTTGTRTPPRPFLTGPLAPPERRIIELDDLVRFVEHPAKAFLRQRLGISLSDFSEEIDDAIPIELDNLEKWGIGDRLLRARLAGTPMDGALIAERARGEVPPGMLADDVLTSASRNVEALVAAAANHFPRTTDLASLDVKLALGDGRTLSGTVPDLCDETLQAIRYSKLKANHRLATWMRLLALSAAWPERTFGAVTIGRSQRRGRTVDVARIAPLTSEHARDALDRLIDLYDRAMLEPVPLVCATSAAYADAVSAQRDPVTAADREWTTSPSSSFDLEDRSLEHRLVFGGTLPLDDLLADPPRADEQWDAGHSSRFAQWAVRLWRDVLEHEEITTT